MLFLVVALVVLGAIAVVASGRGDTLAPAAGAAAHDRSILGLPLPGEPLTGEDLELLRFSVVARGYRPGQVELVLDRVAEALSQRDARIAELERAVADPAPGSARQDEPEPAEDAGPRHLVHRPIEPA